MNTAREQLREVLESEGEIRKIVIVYQRRGKPGEFKHNLTSDAAAIAFVNENLRLSDAELLQIIKGRT